MVHEGPLGTGLLPREPAQAFDERYAGVVLVAQDGAFVVQQRTTGKGVASSGMISLFGGGERPGEDPAACAARELYEELLLKVDPKALRLLGFIDKREANGKITLCTIFKLEGVEVSKLQLREGKSLVVATAPALLGNERVTGVAKASIRAALQLAS